MLYDFKKSIIEYNVIVPTHRPLFLKQCLESILNQKVKPDKVIVILDNTLKNVDEAFQKLDEGRNIQRSHITDCHYRRLDDSKG